MNKSLKITPGALVCNEAEIIGDVTIGVKTVIHPKAKIVAEKGCSIVIGDGNLIEEQTCIINRQPGHTMHIGHCNVFEIGSCVEAVSIGNNNVFEAKTFVGPGIEVGDGCVVGAMCRLHGNSERLPDNTVISGSLCQRRRAHEKPAPQILQLDFLTKILPNYHHMKGKGRA